MRYRLSLLLFLATSFACGGIAVIDEPVGAGGASSSSSNTSTANGSTGSDSTGSGSTGSGMNGCDELVAAYRVALEEAKGCDSDGSGDQCSERANDALRCPCSTMVNPENKDAIAQLEALQAQWSMTSCGDEPCPLIECPDVGDVSCSPSLNGGGRGICVSDNDG